MRKKCSIRLLLAGILLAAAICGSLGFFVGTQKSWSNYEKRITLLQEQNESLAARQEQKEVDAMESLNVVEPYEYILMEEKGYVVVYHTDRKTVYASTDIMIARLPDTLQAEIKKGKYINSEEQLYSFLENYSS